MGDSNDGVAIVDATKAKGAGFVDVLAHLLQIGVCSRCCLRLLDIREHLYAMPPPSPPMILRHISIPATDSMNVESSLAGQSDGTQQGPTNGGLPGPCIACLGILHSVEGDGGRQPGLGDGVKQVVTGEGSRGNGIEQEDKREGNTGKGCEVEGDRRKGQSFQNGVKSQVLGAVKEGGHQISSFCLEVTVPALVAVRDRAIWYHLGQTFSTQRTFQGRPESDSCPVVSLKEALKWALVKPLEEALEARFDSGSDFRIALIFTHRSSAAEVAFIQSQAPPPSAKRRRQGGNWRGGQSGDAGSANGSAPASGSPSSQDGGGRTDSGHLAVAAARAAAEEGESGASVQRAMATMSVDTFQRQYPWPPPKLAEGCALQVLTWRNPVYVGGRYLKYSRSISQSPWLVDDERMGDGSVQELIADDVVPHFKADGCKFQAAGREDIDVRMLGNGRPFLLEILNARVIPSPESMAQIESRINGSKERWVGVRKLQLVGSEATAVMRQGEADKQKVYRALVWLSRPLSPEDLQKLLSLKEVVIQQKTPVRVLHRRSPLTRPRTIHRMEGEQVPGNPHFLVLQLTTQAGTYVKEFVHGDLGRTQPHLGSLLGCEADILQLDVTAIRMEFP